MAQLRQPIGAIGIDCGVSVGHSFNERERKMLTRVDNGDGTVSFSTNELGTMTVSASNVYGTPVEDIYRSTGADSVDSYHEYQEVNYLGIPVGSTGISEIDSALLAYPTPFGAGSAGPGWVTHEQFSSSSIVNFTATTTILGLEVPPHLLQPGVVVREVVVINGEYAIRTFGIGTGINTFDLNFRLAGVVWTYADSKVVDSLVRGVGWQIIDSVSGDEFLYFNYVGRHMLQIASALIVEEYGIGADPVLENNATNLLYSTLPTVLAGGQSISASDIAEMAEKLDQLSDQGIQADQFGAITYIRSALVAYNQLHGTSVAECFLAGTPILLPDGNSKSIESVVSGDIVLSYDANGTLVPGRVTRTFRKEVSHLLDVHGLKAPPGHVTLCGDGIFEGRHVPIIDTLLSDGALVTTEGDLIRMAINKPVGSVEDQFVQVAFALTSEDARAGRLETGEMRVGTLLFDREGEPVSVLDCLTAEGLEFDPVTGLVARPGQAPEPRRWFGPLPRPEAYILRRSREALEEILTDGEWEGAPSELAARRLRHTTNRKVN